MYVSIDENGNKIWNKHIKFAFNAELKPVAYIMLEEYKVSKKHPKPKPRPY